MRVIDELRDLDRAYDASERIEKDTKFLREWAARNGVESNHIDAIVKSVMERCGVKLSPRTAKAGSKVSACSTARRRSPKTKGAKNGKKINRGKS